MTTPWKTTKVSARMVEFLATWQHLTAERGYPPTMREHGKALAIRSTNGVSEWWKRCVMLGLAEADPKLARGHRLTEAGRAIIAAPPAFDARDGAVRATVRTGSGVVLRGFFRAIGAAS